MNIYSNDITFSKHKIQQEAGGNNTFDKCPELLKHKKSQRQYHLNPAHCGLSTKMGTRRHINNPYLQVSDLLFEPLY